MRVRIVTCDTTVEVKENTRKRLLLYLTLLGSERESECVAWTLQCHNQMLATGPWEVVLFTRYLGFV